jgi:sulfur-carrier protein
MQILILIPSALQSYTRSSKVQARGTTLAELFADLDRQYPGICFRMVDEQQRMRSHIRVFVNGASIRDLTLPLPPTDQVSIVQALSGG